MVPAQSRTRSTRSETRFGQVILRQAASAMDKLGQVKVLRNLVSRIARATPSRRLGSSREAKRAALATPLVA